MILQKYPNLLAVKQKKKKIIIIKKFEISRERSLHLSQNSSLGI